MVTSIPREVDPHAGTPVAATQDRLAAWRSPVWLFFLLALLVRAWLVYHTHASIIVVDPSIFVSGSIDRIPAYAAAVQRADRASVLDMIPRNDPYPPFLHRLNAAHLRYRAVRFPTKPGSINVLGVKPLTRTLLPPEAIVLGTHDFPCEI